ncbi:hypothetical protein ANO11243_075970 [Dothideomycetidae sp. 11243]|nr:hypothetical protein ANO11243_075970 [fungal sp. No.11243]
MTVLPNIVVVGGSYVGTNTAKQLAEAFAGRFKVLLIEKNSHFQHLFAFPRFAVVSQVDTHKAFIPFSPGTFQDCPPGSGAVIQAAVTSIGATTLQLDRNVVLDGQPTKSVPFRFIVIATGTKLTPPSTLPGFEKLDGVAYLRKHAQMIVRSSNIVVIGGGAVGMQMVTDIKEVYPHKSVTLVHSRPTVMNKFDKQLSDIVLARCEELHIDTRLGVRVKMPEQAYPTDGSMFEVELMDGSKVPADFAIICTGQTPRSDLIRKAYPEAIDEQGFVRTLKTLQVAARSTSNVFAVGDVADTGAHKAARPGGKQAATVVKNIQHILNSKALEHYEVTDNPGIHMTLGIVSSDLDIG